MKSDSVVDELERTARLGFRSYGKGCIFYMHRLDNTSKMEYFLLTTLQGDLLPGISDDLELMNRMTQYDTVNEYIVIEFIEETGGTVVPTWYILRYRNACVVPSA